MISMKSSWIGVKRRNIGGCFILIFIISLIRLYYSPYNVSSYEYEPRLLNESSRNHTENNNKKLNIVLLYADDVSYRCSFVIISNIICMCMNLHYCYCLKVELQYTWSNGK